MDIKKLAKLAAKEAARNAYNEIMKLAEEPVIGGASLRSAFAALTVYAIFDYNESENPRLVNSSGTCKVTLKNVGKPAAPIYKIASLDVGWSKNGKTEITAKARSFIDQYLISFKGDLPADGLSFTYAWTDSEIPLNKTAIKAAFPNVNLP